MKTLTGHLLICTTLCVALSTHRAYSQGFINFDFEDGQFVPIPGDPYGRVEFAPAMPGWAGYVGTNQVNWILHNNQFLDTAGIAIYGPDNPYPDYLHGHYSVLLQRGLDPAASGSVTVSSGISQTGVIPPTAQSIQFFSFAPYVIAIGLSFEGAQIPLYHLSSRSNGRQIWGGDISIFAGQFGKLRFFGEGTLDFIQFSDQPIPEPSTVGLLGLGAWLFGWRFGRGRAAPPTSRRAPTPRSP